MTWRLIPHLIFVFGMTGVSVANPTAAEVGHVTPPHAVRGALHTRLSDVKVSDFPQVSVVLTVFSEKGHPVAGLTKDALTMTENGAPVTLTEVLVDDAPLTLGLVLDVSGSMEPAMKELKLAAGELVRGLGNSDEILAFSFGDRASELPGSSRRAVVDEINKLEPYGATALYDGLEMALERLNQRGGRRFVVCFTDGVDQNSDGTGPQSATTARNVAKLAIDSKIPIYSIGLGAKVDRTLLIKLAGVTHGQFYNPKDASLLRKAFARALFDLRLQYRLTYTSPKPDKDGSTRVLEVTSRAQGHEGQGKGQYTAPVPPPPVPKEWVVSASPGAAGPLAQVTSRRKTTSRVRFSGFVKPDYGAGWMRVQEPDPKNEGAWMDARSHHMVDLRNRGESEVKTFLPGIYRFNNFGPDRGDPVVFTVDVELKGGENLLITPEGVRVAPEDPEEPTDGEDSGDSEDSDDSSREDSP